MEDCGIIICGKSDIVEIFELQKRGMNADPLRKRCSGAAEDIARLLWSCPHSTKVWQLSSTKLGMDVIAEVGNSCFSEFMTAKSLGSEQH